MVILKIFLNRKQKKKNWVKMDFMQQYLLMKKVRRNQDLKKQESLLHRSKSIFNNFKIIIIYQFPFYIIYNLKILLIRKIKRIPIDKYDDATKGFFKNFLY